MENHSSLSRDKTFRKKSFTFIAFGLVVIVSVYAVLISVEKFFVGSSQSGEQGSSYATIKMGSRAWSDLLSLNGYDVTRDRGAITLPKLSNDIEPSQNSLTLSRRTSTVIILSGALPQDETDELKTYISKGGRLITDNPYLLEQFFPRDITFEIEGKTKMYPVPYVDGLEDIETISTSGLGLIAFEESRTKQPLLTDSRLEYQNSSDSTYLSSAALFRYGQGDVVVLVDIGPVSNQLLTKEHNALFSLRIVGSTGSRVTFAEGVHGYSDAKGFAGMPIGWRIGLIGILTSFVIFACSQGRRFGVGEEPNRNLGPRRIYFAHALAHALKKSKK